MFHGNYSSPGAGKDIPGGATLRFEVELVRISDQAEEKKQPMRNIFGEMDTNSDLSVDYVEFENWFKTNGVNDGKVPHGLWEKEDKNMDKLISFDEFSGPKTAAAQDL